MFLRKRGRRFLLLHSYRDGQGRVCQARLGHFDDVEEARRCLDSPAWRREFAGRFPDLEVDWARVAQQAAETPASSSPARRANGARSLEVRLNESLSAFLRLWAQVADVELRQRVAEVLRHGLRLNDLDGAHLEALAWKAKARLDPRRTDFRDGEGEEYLKTLSLQAEELKARGEHREACQLLAVVARGQSSPEHQANYGEALQLLGRTEEAVTEYERIPRNQAVRHYNLASVHLQVGRMDKALGCLLDGMLRDPHVARASKNLREGKPLAVGQEYWERFGHLWDPVGRWFMLGLYSQPLVRSRLTRAAETRRTPRELVSGPARRLLLQRVLHWDPPKPQRTARRKRSKTASQSES